MSNSSHINRKRSTRQTRRTSTATSLPSAPATSSGPSTSHQPQKTVEVESNRTNFELIFIEFFELFFTNHKFSNPTNFERIQHLKNLTPPYSWNRTNRTNFELIFIEFFE